MTHCVGRVLQRSSAPSSKCAFFNDDGGFSTAGMAVALLVSLSLVFGSAQVYRIHSACADVQNTADAAALSAEGQVASFYVVAQVCDAIVLSLSVAGITCAGAGIVALCIPPAQPIAEKLLEAGHRISEARTRFSQSAAKGLDSLQRLLPFFAAAQAARVAQANNSSASDYVAVAVLLPLRGASIDVPDNEAANAFDQQALDQKDQIAQAAKDAEEAAEKADEHKRIAFEADCGANPNYCMYERAGKLAGLSGTENPFYASIDAWSFSVAMNRAKAYYPRRLAQERPSNGSVEEQASSVLRTYFYEYACRQIAQGYVHESSTSFKANFPLLARNTSQMRQTELYTQIRYPITVDEAGQRTMHAWGGCPVVQELGSVGDGSVQQYEAEGMSICPQCEFSASRVGKIAAATTSTASGFEHYYRIVAEQAAVYQKAREELEAASQQVKRPVEDLLDAAKEALSEAARARIQVQPPGSVGAIALVADTKGVSAGSLVPSAFVANSGTLGTRAAIAGATFAQDEPDETSNVIAALFDGFQDKAIPLAGLPQAAAGLWGHALFSYRKGTQAVESAVKSILEKVPLVGKSGLGDWASNKIDQAIQGAGLEPVELAAYKPVLVNTYHVASNDDGSLSYGLLGAKSAYSQAAGSATGNPLSVLVGVGAGQLQSDIDALGDGIVVARIEFMGASGPGIDIRIPLPAAVSAGAKGLIDSAVATIQGIVAQGGVQRRWE